MTEESNSELVFLKQLLSEAKAKYESSAKTPDDQREYIVKLKVLTTMIHDYADRVEESNKRKEAQIESTKAKLRESQSEMWQLNKEIAMLKAKKKITGNKK